MNETTNLNSELLSADARGRKHIPLAVFAVILIHIVLFLVLLIAAGCRAKARAIRSSQAPAEVAILQEKPLVTTNAPGPAAVVAESRIVREPSVQAQRTAPPTVRQTPQRSSVPLSGRSAAKESRKAKIYVVKAGDTVEKIARMHRTSIEAIKAENNLKNYLLRPGQELRVSSEKPKRSNEV